MMQGGGFDREPACYDRARPRYPEALFDRMVNCCNLSSGMRALEIGPGTGQATEPLARRGLHICAVELGAALGGIARANLAHYPDVEIVTGNFETIDLPEAAFDLVYAATSLHWIDPDQRFSKPHRLLKTGGYLAVIHTEHVSDEAGDEFVCATQSVYREFTPGTEDFRPPPITELKAILLNPALFHPICFETYPTRIGYTATAYVELLRTFSPTIAMPPKTRERFLEGIAVVIDRDFGGRIVKHVAMTLQIARAI